MIRGRAHLLGDGINTDLHASSKYRHIGKDVPTLARHAFEELDPELARRVAPGDLIVAGKDFGANSSREQAVQVIRAMGIAAIVARSFGRQFFRSAINNGLAVVECDTRGIESGDEVTVDLGQGRIVVPARGLVLDVPPLPVAVRAILSAGGLIPFLKANPDWEAR